MQSSPRHPDHKLLSILFCNQSQHIKGFGLEVELKFQAFVAPMGSLEDHSLSHAMYRRKEAEEKMGTLLGFW